MSLLDYTVIKSYEELLAYKKKWDTDLSKAHRDGIFHAFSQEVRAYPVALLTGYTVNEGGTIHIGHEVINIDDAEELWRDLNTAYKEIGGK